MFPRAIPRAQPPLSFHLQVSIVAEQLLRLLHHCGMPPSDADLVHGSGVTMNDIMVQAQPRSTLFTGSQRVAEKLAADMRGKVNRRRNVSHCASNLDVVVSFLTWVASFDMNRLVCFGSSVMSWGYSWCLGGCIQ